MRTSGQITVREVPGQKFNFLWFGGGEPEWDVGDQLSNDFSFPRQPPSVAGWSQRAVTRSSTTPHHAGAGDSAAAAVTPAADGSESEARPGSRKQQCKRNRGARAEWMPR